MYWSSSSMKSTVDDFIYKHLSHNDNFTLSISRILRSSITRSSHHYFRLHQLLDMYPFFEERHVTVAEWYDCFRYRQSQFLYEGLAPRRFQSSKICKPSISTLIVLSKWCEKKRYNGEEQKNKQYIQKKIFTNKYNWNTYLLDLCWTYESIAFEITAKRICLGNWCSIIAPIFI